MKDDLLPIIIKPLKATECKHGCLAQLGEHLFDVQEVTGSIPVAPTMFGNNNRASRGFILSCSPLW